MLASVVLALVPLARLGVELGRYADLGLPLTITPTRGTDGVRWSIAADGGFRATHVVRGGPADRAGVREGDRLLRIDLDPIETRVELRQAVERATGAVLRYDLRRASGRVRADVAIDRAPTFLYPKSPLVWTASAWGFALATVVHIGALWIVLPLARTSQRGRRAAVLIGAALVWVGGNLVRIAWVAATGRPGVTAAGEVLFDVVTLIALAGWVAFPALLFRQGLLNDRRLARATAPVHAALWLPPLVLGGSIGWATVAGHLGPLPPDAFVAPILFYVCVTVAASMALAVGVPRAGTAPSAWSRAGSAMVLAVSVAAAAIVWFRLPSYRPDAGPQAEGFVTALQLFSVLPVGLVSLSTLRFGPVDIVLTRGVAYLGTLAVVFAIVAGGTALMDAAVPGPAGAGPVALALFLVVVFVVIDRSAPRVRRVAERVVGSRSQEASRVLDRFAERMQTLVDPETLAREAAATVGAAFRPESAVVFLRAGRGAGPERWVRGGYRPSPPYFTEVELEHIWSVLEAQDAVWSRDPELREATLGPRQARRLGELGVALAVPVATPEDEPAGLIVLGRRSGLRVYTTADVARLRSLGAQLALATERLALIERETWLVRQTAEAELTALRAQINPHFLFNALNTVSSLIAERPADAETTLQSLAGLFRDVLNASGRPSVSLRDELRLVGRYLDVEQSRFGDKLHVEIDVEPAVLDHPVPAFAVQTIVENAVKHGIERKRGGGSLRLSAASAPGDALRVDVEDTGVGIPELFAAGHAETTPAEPVAASNLSPPDFYGVGLGNVHERLQQLFGPGEWLVYRSTPGRTLATLTVPHQHAPASPHRR